MPSCEELKCMSRVTRCADLVRSLSAHSHESSGLVRHPDSTTIVAVGGYLTAGHELMLTQARAFRPNSVQGVMA